jgi:aspartate ammonia-lyase
MDFHKIGKFLKQVELFSGLNEEELGVISKMILTKIYKKGSFLFREKGARLELFVISSGEIEIVQNTPHGEERVIAFGKGDFIGEGALLDNFPHATSAKAVTKTTVLQFKRVDFQELMKTRPKIAVKLISKATRIISRRIRSSGGRIQNAGLQYLSGETRTEHDLLGEKEVPCEAYYGIQTMRALENFNISGVPISHHPQLLEALAMVKLAATRANLELRLLPKDVASAIERACLEIIKGRFHTHFVVDLIQGGAGTSTNMNANEVIANRALELMGYRKGEYKFCHPNNHVNLSQSTNDVYPTALKIALINSNKKLTRILGGLIDTLEKKGKEFSGIIKMGRTQLQDAVPMTLGQTFDAYAVTIGEEIVRLNQNAKLFLEINLGGTAIGTGIAAKPEYRAKALRHLSKISGLNLVSAFNLLEATQDTGSFVIYSSALKRLAVKLSKIASDLRLLSSGPRAGINEINLPAMQPGSSIMPGKVNPVIPEVLNQICYKVIGNDLSVTLAAEAGQLELNVMEPIIAQSIFESIEMLINGILTFDERAVSGITANAIRCRKMVENSLGLVTALLPVLGYEKCTELAKEAMKKNVGVYELVLKKGLLSKRRLLNLLKPENMI